MPSCVIPILSKAGGNRHPVAAVLLLRVVQGVVGITDLHTPSAGFPDHISVRIVGVASRAGLRIGGRYELRETVIGKMSTPVQPIEIPKSDRPMRCSRSPFPWTPSDGHRSVPAPSWVVRECLKSAATGCRSRPWRSRWGRCSSMFAFWFHLSRPGLRCGPVGHRRMSLYRLTVRMLRGMGSTAGTLLFPSRSVRIMKRVGARCGQEDWCGPASLGSYSLMGSGSRSFGRFPQHALLLLAHGNPSQLVSSLTLGAC